MRKDDIIEIASNRFIERLGISGDLNFSHKIGHMSNNVITVNVISINTDRLLISITSQEPEWELSFIENLCLEIFHTRNFKVLNYKI